MARPQVPGWQNINPSKTEEYSSEYKVSGRRFANVTNVANGQRQLFVINELNQRTLLTTTNADGSVQKQPAYDQFVNTFGQDTFTNAEINNKKQSQFIVSQASTAQEKASLAKTQQYQSSTGNTASAAETTGSNSAAAGGTNASISQETVAAAAEAQSTVERDTKGEKGDDLRYPLNNTYQGDFIQIEMRTYKKSGFQTDTDTLTITRMEDREYEPLRKIYLPIQSGIVDSVSVDWGNGELNPITAQFANVAQGTLVQAGTGNIGAAAKSLAFGLGDVADKLLTQGGDLQKLVTNYFTEQAVGTPGLLSRSIGGAINNNLELLFNGPTLRSFTFNFKLTPREPAEAQRIKDIIRVFKKGMTPQLSKSGLFLSAPNVFKIKYIYTGKGNLTEDHPYLNRIKVAALRDFSVNYTPDGNYMTYNGEGSMTQYDLSMTFGEIDPVYADDYDVEEGTKGMGW
jgi:hypothetical protein